MPRTHATTPAPEGPPARGDLVDHLDDTDTGRWQITTEASLYVLDLDTRSFTRLPGAGALADSQAIAVTTLPGDHQPLPLFAVLQCTLGYNLILLSEPNPDGSINYRVSTYVLEIRRLPNPIRTPES